MLWCIKHRTLHNALIENLATINCLFYSLKCVTDWWRDAWTDSLLSCCSLLAQVTRRVITRSLASRHDTYSWPFATTTNSTSFCLEWLLLRAASFPTYRPSFCLRPRGMLPCLHCVLENNLQFSRIKFTVTNLNPFYIFWHVRLNLLNILPIILYVSTIHGDILNF